ncbi:MAG: hypothetical protein DI628_04310 [Blastochloris viridis]|uniref:Tetratricopeptide repeat protein n=1 Tax=Blastochloris viridis TaxID=1079 RepID=A0A6N4RF11_BLAVI|nr:MAG: hypothetical protein DI628_04310 [Blastochloris viridis]
MMVISTPLWAVTVGPLHGKPGPSLRALGTPAGSIATEELLDTSFPGSLEERGDLPSALLEWQRIAHKSFGAEREMALTNATRLSIALERPQVANALLTELLTQNPASPYAPEALYHLATGTDTMAAAQAFGQLQKIFPNNPWTEAAQMNEVWQQAHRAGKVVNTYNLPKAEDLRKRLRTMYAAEQARIGLAGAMGVIMPGLGHMYAGNMPQGIAVLIIWCLFTLAFLSACRHRHYAYSFLFVIPSAALWLTGPVVAMELAKDQRDKKIEASLAKWDDLRPVIPSDIPPESEAPPPAAVTPAAPEAVSSTEASPAAVLPQGKLITPTRM